MEGVRTNPRRYSVICWALISFFSLLICVSAVSAVSDPDQPLLWIAETRGILTVHQADGSIQSEIPLAHEARTVAVDRQRDSIWLFSGKSVRGFDLDGAQKFATEINPPAGEPVFLTVDALDGSAWLAVQAQLYQLNERGMLLSERRMPQPISGITLD
ncbi:MAG: hypothetical protein ACRES4_04125, partial [Nevskiales bacterium]